MTKDPRETFLKTAESITREILQRTFHKHLLKESQQKFLKKFVPSVPERTPY